MSIQGRNFSLTQYPTLRTQSPTLYLLQQVGRRRLPAITWLKSQLKQIEIIWILDLKFDKPIFSFFISLFLVNILSWFLKNKQNNNKSHNKVKYRPCSALVPPTCGKHTILQYLPAFNRHNVIYIRVQRDLFIFWLKNDYF